MSTSEARSAVDILRAESAAGKAVIDEVAAKRLLRRIGVSVPAGHVVESLDEAREAIQQLGLPVAIKAIVPDVVHKTEIDALRGPVTTDDEVRDAVAALLARHRCPLLVEKWCAGSVELLVGLSFKSQFGPVVSTAAGGHWVEVFEDVAHRLAPVDSEEASDMLASLKAVALFAGGRRHDEIPIATAAEAIARISSLAADPGVVEVLDVFEVNPLVVHNDGSVTAVDCVATVWTSRATEQYERAGERGV